MIKMWKTCYAHNGELLTANTLACRLRKGEEKHRRTDGYTYMVVDGTPGGTPDRLFFSRRNRQEKWRA